MPESALQNFEGRPFGYPITESASSAHQLHDAVAVVCDTGVTAGHGELCLIQKGCSAELVRVEIPAPAPENTPGGNVRICLVHVVVDPEGNAKSCQASPDTAYLVRGYFDRAGDFHQIHAVGVNLLAASRQPVAAQGG
tara:strand:- start:895 stop:1308 length:414 start_codon:yes stop_codon:yes gene_type:complete